MPERPGIHQQEHFMSESRRLFLSSAAAGAALAAWPAGAAAAATSHAGLARRIALEFNRLPGRKGLKIWAPGQQRDGDFLATIAPDTALFCASSFKAFVLGEYLRQMEAGQTTLGELLPVDERVWSLGAPVLTPLPGTVSGQYQALSTLQAMISRSDNTATDMALARIGADRVRQFIASIGLQNTRIPNSTRQFFAYVGGAANWQTIGFAELLALIQSDAPPAHRIVNDVQTMAVSPHDFVSYYSRALQGQFFQRDETLQTFRSVLALADAIPLTMPLGVNAFMKGGSIDFGGEHTLSIAGGVFVPPRRWAYYSLMINWLDGEGGDVAEVQAPFTATCKRIFTWLAEALGRAADD
jgi:beta-lactamase class A